MAAPRTDQDFAAAIKELQAGRNIHSENQPDENNANRIGLGAEGHFDTDIYSEKFSGQFVDSIAPNDEQDDDDDMGQMLGKKPSSYSAPLNVLNDLAQDKDYDPFAEHKPKKVRDRDNDYKAQKRPVRMISPDRHDPFADGMVICLSISVPGTPRNNF
ncbi:hypothetical protein EB796_012031 [Bugula neritina]|uniref:Uncharacterized protein n=1 Tax=Bugula neritina TaxID=10212 RepID=A0A7J7JTJ5_BUGNE|nr:hypothetical protein EB796_012031 [Bugula neritina]